MFQPPSEPRWVACLSGSQITAVQHGCGAGDAPVNCVIDENRNWVCPNCMATYGAAMPLAEWKAIEPTAASEPAPPGSVRP